MNYEKRAKCKRKLKFIKKKRMEHTAGWGIENFHSVRQMRCGGGPSTRKSKKTLAKRPK